MFRQGSKNDLGRKKSETSGFRTLNSIIFAWVVSLALLAAMPSRASENIRIIAVGDSLTAGYLIGPNEAFPAQLAQALKNAGMSALVENAGVSGDTSSGGLARLEWSLGSQAPDMVILQLGANDALRGIPVDVTRKNLDRMIEALKDRGITVLLAGMLAPPNMGADYESDFNSIYPALSQKHGVALYPFFLDGVAAQPTLNLDDGIHPTPEGVSVIVEKILPYVAQALVEAGRCDNAERALCGETIVDLASEQSS